MKEMSYIADKFEELGVVPVVVLENTKDALPLAKALMEGGLPCAEVTFRTEAAQESIRLMAQEYPDMLVGAGTVLTTKQVDEAIEAGAKFIVSPGFDPEIVDYCQEKGIEIFPGCVSPSEVAQAVKKGLKVVKFFPAEQAGGIDMIKAMAAPYHELRFMPTGGINPNNLEKYLTFNKILCCGGSWMVKGDLVKAGDFDKIQELKKEAKELVENAIENSKEGIMIFEQFMPWEEAVLTSTNPKAEKINFVVFPSNRGGFCVHTVPKELGSFENRKSLPKEWAGLRDEKLQEVSKIKTAKFCHNACFICTAETREDAIKMAEIAQRT